MKKKILALSLAAVLLAALTFGGTVAYFKAEDSAENTMTLGSVAIDQLEYERKVDADGLWIPSNDGDELQEFTQDKPLFPVVGEVIWDNRADGHVQRFTQIGATGSMKLYDDSVKGVVDKMVFVENTGLSDAYVRTLVALEHGDCSENDELIIASFGTDSSWEIGSSFFTEIDGNNYKVVELIYTENDGVLASTEITASPSLAQVYAVSSVTNEDIVDLDGNDNDKYDILVLSQACQVAGFESVGAETALDTAFGDVTEANAADWFEEIL